METLVTLAVVCGVLAATGGAHAALQGDFGWTAPVMMAMTDLNTGPQNQAGVGANVPLTYFGPTPSQVNPMLVGPVQLLKSGVVDPQKPSITLPLYRGRVGNEYYWYIVTDTSDAAIAASLGINPSAKLQFALVQEGSYRTGTLDKNLTLVTDFGTVDFTPERKVTPGNGSAPFPPSVAEPGSVGKDKYTPLVKIGPSIYNAPIIAGNVPAEALAEFCGETNGTAFNYVHDRVLSICPDVEGASGGNVTLELVHGFSFGKPILYVTLDSSDDTTAALEGITYAPALGNINVGGDDSLFSAVERIFVISNGYTNAAINTAKLQDGPSETVHPLRQGLSSVLSGDKGGPLNVLGGIPTVATDYSPMWDFNLGEWTSYAVSNHYRTRLTDEFQFLEFVQRGFITGPDGDTFGSTGIIVNCPIVQRFL
eukprot:jgi/Botrbrau1/2344/Bobra.39_1s0032.1